MTDAYTHAPIGADALSREEIERIESQVWNLRYLDDEERAENHKFASLIADALASAAQPAAVPPGYVLVPDAANMTDAQAEAIAEQANCCGGTAYDIYRAALAAAPKAAPAAQGDAPTDSGPISRKWLTVVYQDVAAGDEARALCLHPKASAMSWSHAIRDRDAARAAKEGGAT